MYNITCSIKYLKKHHMNIGILHITTTVVMRLMYTIALSLIQHTSITIICVIYKLKQKLNIRYTIYNSICQESLQFVYIRIIPCAQKKKFC